MSKEDKLVNRFRSLPSDISFSDVKNLLEMYGFEEVRSSSSHHIFRHPNGQRQVVPKKHGQRVKGVYIKQVVKLLGLDDE